MQIAGLRGSDDPGEGRGGEGRGNFMTVNWRSSCTYFGSEISST